MNTIRTVEMVNDLYIHYSFNGEDRFLWYKRGYTEGVYLATTTTRAPDIHHIAKLIDGELLLEYFEYRDEINGVESIRNAIAEYNSENSYLNREEMR